MSNNDIFKKLRVALHLRNDEIIDILKLVNFNVSKAELGDIFRNEDHPNFKKCGDQILRNFLNGLIIHMRGPKEEHEKRENEKQTPHKKRE
ncbi:MAG TPA: DUF1456 family protein [Cytophagaceae bacterium]|nr:DUF1456 family protein [Cytophagaceae bacterium]